MPSASANRITFNLQPSMPINPKLAKLIEAVGEFSEQRSEINKKTIGVITARFVGLLSARFSHICDAAHEEENNGKIAVGIPIKLDLSAKSPVGTIGLTFTPSKVNDSTGFKVDDPDQEILPLTEGGANPPARATRAPRRPRRARATVVEVTTAA